MSVYIDGTSIHTTGPKRIHFDVVSGFIDELHEFRGEDDEIIGAEGYEYGGRDGDRRRIQLAGWVYGTGNDHATRKADYLAAAQELVALLDPTDDTHELKVIGPYRGLAAGKQATINIFYVGATWSPLTGGGTARQGVIVVESIDSPPVWTISDVP